MALILRKAGLLSTIQDLGRTGYRRLGINPGGAMDRFAARIANILVGNPESAPVVEFHFPAPEIEFDSDTFFAICGAELEARLDGDTSKHCSVTFAPAGSVLNFTRKISGERGYLAVAGGPVADSWLGSSSTNLTAGIGGHSGRALAIGDTIHAGSDLSSTVPDLTCGPSLTSYLSDSSPIRIIAGPEFHTLTAEGTNTLQSGEFLLTSDCDRMGYRLSGPPVDRSDTNEMISAAVTYGTIQLLPDGQLIILMADHQTSGGYPRIANVVSTDLAALAQKGPGQLVAFELVSIDEAESLIYRLERELNFLRAGCRLQTLNAERRSQLRPR